MGGRGPKPASQPSEVCGARAAQCRSSRERRASPVQQPLALGSAQWWGDGEHDSPGEYLDMKCCMFPAIGMGTRHTAPGMGARSVLTTLPTESNVQSTPVKSRRLGDSLQHLWQLVDRLPRGQPPWRPGSVSCCLNAQPLQPCLVRMRSQRPDHCPGATDRCDTRIVAALTDIFPSAPSACSRALADPSRWRDDRSFAIREAKSPILPNL
jgi:hypothetical protein